MDKINKEVLRSTKQAKKVPLRYTRNKKGIIQQNQKMKTLGANKEKIHYFLLAEV